MTIRSLIRSSPIRSLASSALGGGGAGGGGGGGGVDPAATALIGRMTTPPSTNRAAAIDTLIKALKAGGSWVKRDGIWVWWAADTQAANLNWKSTSFPYAPNGAMNFAANQGYAGNGTTAKGSFGVTFSLLTQFQQNSASCGIWNITAGDADTVEIGINTTDTNFYMLVRNSVGNMSARINGATNTSAAVASAVGYSMMNRSAAGALQLYKDGVDIGSDTVASSARSNNDLTSHNVNNIAFSSRRLSAVLIGGSLTAGEALAEYNALAAYMASDP